MRPIGAGAQTILASDSPRGVAFLQLDFASGTQRLTTAASSMTWAGQTWIGLGGLLSIEPIAESVGSEIKGGVIRLSGVAASQISDALSENVQGRTCTMWFGVLTDTWAVEDAPIEFVGRMNRYRIQRDSPTSTLELSVESEMAMARRPKVRRFSDSDQRAAYPGDAYFSHLLKTAEQIIRFPTAQAQGR